MQRGLNMSFVIAEPDFVTAAAGQLAGIQSSIGAAAEAAAVPTTGIAEAAADEISAAISRLFGAYGQEFQAASAQAAAFHAEFVRLLDGGAAAYLSAEVANVERTLLSGAVGFPAAAPTDPLSGLLGGLLGGQTTTGGGLLGPLTGTGGLSLGGVNFVLPSLPSLLSPTTLTSVLTDLGGATGQLGPILGNLGTSVQNLLFPQLAAPGVAAYPNPYQVLFDNTVRNLSDLGANYRPFPILNQIAVNQAHYAQLAGNALALNLQGFPGNVPANVQLALQEASKFNPAVGVQAFVGGTTGFYSTLGTQLSAFGEGIQQTFPTFQRDLNLAGLAIQQGQYSQAVQYGARSLVDLFITGFDTSGLGITVDLTNPLAPAIVISGPIGVEGPAGALLPILSAIGQQVQGAASLIPAGSIPGMMAQNFANGINTLTNAGVSADFALTLGLPPSLTGEAIFGLPLQLGFAILGPPFAGLNGLAEGATAFSTSMASGNLWGAANAIGNTPAFVLDGFLNGEVLLDQPLPVTLTLLGLPVTIPVTAHLPFTGILVPPHGITATAELSQLLPIPGLPDITVPLGGTEFGGIVPFLLNTLPQQIAQSMAYTNTAA